MGDLRKLILFSDSRTTRRNAATKSRMTVRAQTVGGACAQANAQFVLL